MREEHGAETLRREAGPGRGEREGGLLDLLDLLRRMVGSRQPAVLVMERDGQLRRASRTENEPSA